MRADVGVGVEVDHVALLVSVERVLDRLELRAPSAKEERKGQTSSRMKDRQGSWVAGRVSVWFEREVTGGAREQA